MAARATRAAVFMKFKTGGITNGDIFYEDARFIGTFLRSIGRRAAFCCIPTVSFAVRIISAVCCTDVVVQTRRDLLVEFIRVS